MAEAFGWSLLHMVVIKENRRTHVCRNAHGALASIVRRRRNTQTGACTGCLSSLELWEWEVRGREVEVSAAAASRDKR